MSPAPDDVQAAEDLTTLIDRVPAGWSTVRYRGRRWSLTRSDHVGGQSLSVYATELGGTGVVSANVYRTGAGEVLKPCEMPAEVVLDFLSGWRVDEADRAARPSTPR